MIRAGPSRIERLKEPAMTIDLIDRAVLRVGRDSDRIRRFLT